MINDDIIEENQAAENQAAENQAAENQAAENQAAEEHVAEDNAAEENELLAETSEEVVIEELSLEDEFVEPIEEAEEEILAETLEGSELEGFESAEVEDTEFVEDERIMSILESVLFSTERPQSISTIKQAFKGTNVQTKQIKRSLEALMVEYAGSQRGITIEEVTGGYQLRTKSDNMDYLRRMVKSRPFKLSGPALEVLSIVAYKQPCAKINVDEVRGVESGHLLRGLMEKGLCAFAGKSELPGKPMLYQTTRKFLEIFGLRNLQELPTLSEIDELLPEGIEPEQVEKKETLDEVAGDLAQEAISSYSSSEEELNKITDKLGEINTSSDFFVEEKRREKERREKERAEDIRESIEFSESVEDKDIKWLARYDKEQEDRLKAEEEKLKAKEQVLHAQEEVLADERHELEEMLEAAPAEDAEVIEGVSTVEEKALQASEQVAEQVAEQSSEQVHEQVVEQDSEPASESDTESEIIAAQESEPAEAQEVIEDLNVEVKKVPASPGSKKNSELLPLVSESIMAALEAASEAKLYDEVETTEESSELKNEEID